MAQAILEKLIAVSFLILLVCVIRVVGRGKIRSGLIYSLWGLAALRLLWPAALVLPASPYSVQNLEVSQRIAQEYVSAQEDRWAQHSGNAETVPGEDASKETSDLPSAVQEGAHSGRQTEADVSGSTGTMANIGTTGNTGTTGSTGISGNTDNPGITGVPWSSTGTELDGERRDLAGTSQTPRKDSFTGQPWDFVRGIGAAWSGLPWFGKVWLAGSVLLGSFVMITQLHFSTRLKRERILWTDGSREPEPVERALPIYVWERAQSPFLYGVMHPSIYITGECAADEEKRQYVILHEWCHYRHGDHIWALVRMLCLVLYWYHPLVWVAAALSRTDCELACDDSARARLGDTQRLCYANALVSVLENGMRTQRIGDMTTSMSGGGKEAARRLTLLWKKRPGRVVSAVLACVLAVCLGVSAFTSGSGQDGRQGMGGEILDQSESGKTDESPSPQESPAAMEAGACAENPIPAEPGDRLLEGIYYSCDIDGRDGAEIFCYLGGQMNTAYPQFEVDGWTVTLTDCELEDPIQERVEGEPAETALREVYYVTDIREGDGQREFALLDRSDYDGNLTIFCKYERGILMEIGTVEGYPFVREHDPDCEAAALVGIDGQGRIVSTFQLDLAQMWSAVQTWELTEDGTLAEKKPEHGWYAGLQTVCCADEGAGSYAAGSEYGDGYHKRDEPPYLWRRDLRLFVEPHWNADTIVLEYQDEEEAGQRLTVTLTHTDNEHWVRLEAEDGRAGWIYLETADVMWTENSFLSLEEMINMLPPIKWRYHHLDYEEIREIYLQRALARDPIPVEVKTEGSQLVSHVLYQADLDGDGEMDQFCYAGSMGNNCRPCFIINGKKYEVGEGCLPTVGWGGSILLGLIHEVFYLCDITAGDGQMEFALADHGEEGYAETDWLAFDGYMMRHIGTIDGHAFLQEHFRDAEAQVKFQNGVWGLDGQGRIGTWEKLDLLDELWADVVWELNPRTHMLEMVEPSDGMYVNSESRYFVLQGDYAPGNQMLYSLSQDMILYREPDLSADTFVMETEAAGYSTRVYLTHTDGQHWGRIEKEGGEAGWFYLDGNRLVLPDETAETRFGYYIQQNYLMREWNGNGENGTSLTGEYPFLAQAAEHVTVEDRETALLSGILYTADLDGDGQREEFAYCGLETRVNEPHWGAGQTYPTFIGGMASV